MQMGYILYYDSTGDTRLLKLLKAVVISEAEANVMDSVQTWSCDLSSCTEKNLPLQFIENSVTKPTNSWHSIYHHKDILSGILQPGMPLN